MCTCVLGLEGEGAILEGESILAWSSWESLLDAVALCHHLARVAVQVFRLNCSRFLLHSFDPQSPAHVGVMTRSV